MPIYQIQSDREVESQATALIRRLVFSLALLVGIALVSTVVMAAFEPGDDPIADRLSEGLWDTLQLITTVGSLDEPPSPSQRVWDMFVIVFGLGAVLYAFGSLQSLLHSGEVADHFRRKRMGQRLDALVGHYVICGFGRMGAEVAQRIHAAGHHLVVIERDHEAARRASDLEYLVVEGDCESEQTLREAGVERATGLVATLDNDAGNVYLSMISREMNPTLRLVSRAGSEQSRRALRRAGVDRCTVPGEIVGLELSQLVLKPRISEFISGAIGDGEYEFAEIEVSLHPWMHGKALKELDLPRGSGIIVISVMDSEEKTTFNPTADHVLHDLDVLLVVTREGGIEELSRRLQPQDEEYERGT